MQNSALAGTLATNNGPQHHATHSNVLYSPQSMGSSGIHKVVPETTTPFFKGIQSDVKKFVQVLLSDRSVNLVISPFLVTTTEAITARVMNEVGLNVGLNESAIVSDHIPPNIMDTVKGLHVQSKEEHIDKALEQLNISHTTSAELRQKGYAQATAELNARIAKDTQGMITDLLDPNNLEDPTLAFRLVTWLFEHVSWEEPFELMNDVDSSAMTWQNTTHPEIQWMESGGETHTIKHTRSDGYDFIAVPVKETGIKAVLVLPPSEETNHNSEDLNRVLLNGLTSILGKAENNRAEITLPKFKFDYEYTTEHSEAGAIATHKAALNIDEEGADVAATSEMLAYACCASTIKYPKFDFDHPFYFAIIDHENAEKPRVVGMAWIKQPWNS
ncbi:serpin family protein [Endozoicomonas sp. ONNA2]|uniref:serpin family protein n=1 Tax=Endozoicomonas sp. ONNA2 TaxID=2828741 RepID=UPI0021487982|nr:serpin family protein [Endozoicomonas sp. ONNA2]